MIDVTRDRSGEQGNVLEKDRDIRAVFRRLSLRVGRRSVPLWWAKTMSIESRSNKTPPEYGKSAIQWRECANHTINESHRDKRDRHDRNRSRYNATADRFRLATGPGTQDKN
jgi:hypothetical protein